MQQKAYLDVLIRVVTALQEATRDTRLADLDAEQIHFWLSQVEVADVEAALREAGMARTLQAVLAADRKILKLQSASFRKTTPAAAGPREKHCRVIPMIRPTLTKKTGNI